MTTISITKKKSIIWSTGLAMFAMFFGAGNIVFPLALGQFAQDKNFYGILGMMMTAVIVPLLGLLGMMLFDGDYLAFFRRIGKAPGFLLTLMILGLIGPFGGIPRCITISYSTLATFGLEGVLGFSLPIFSLISCLLIFLFTFRPNRILPIMGYVLTPLLLIALAVVVIKGMFVMPETTPSLLTRWEVFSHGFVGGYNTMDLLASFFFSSVVLLCLKRDKNGGMPFKENRSLIKVAIWASVVASFLLSAVYVCFSYLAAGHSEMLHGIAHQELLGTLAYLHLGPYAGLIAGSVVAFACLTTEIALSVILAEFLRKTIFKEKINYPTALAIILGLSFMISTFRFEGISTFLVPVLQICYPALIVLTLLNIAYKLYEFKPVKLIFYGTFALSLTAYFLI